MFKHWSQQMLAAINRKASKACQMVDNVNIVQRQVLAAIDSGDDFSYQLAQVIANYDNFDQTKGYKP